MIDEEPRWLAEAMLQVALSVAGADDHVDDKEAAATGQIMRDLAFGLESPMARAAATLAASDSSIIGALVRKTPKSVFENARDELESMPRSERLSIYLAMFVIGYTVASAHRKGAFARSAVSNEERVAVRLCLEMMGATGVDIMEAVKGLPPEAV